MSLEMVIHHHSLSGWDLADGGSPGPDGEKPKFNWLPDLSRTFGDCTAQPVFRLFLAVSVR